MIDVQTIGVLVAAASVSMAAIYYLFTLRINMKTQELTLKTQQQNLETRQAQLFTQVLSRYYETEFSDIIMTLFKREWNSYDDWARDGNDPKIGHRNNTIITYFNGLGVLVKRGFIDSELVANILGGVLIMYWDKQAEYIKEFRVRANWPHYGEFFEYLYEEMKKHRPVGYSPMVTFSKITQ